MGVCEPSGPGQDDGLHLFKAPHLQDLSSCGPQGRGHPYRAEEAQPFLEGPLFYCLSGRIQTASGQAWAEQGEGDLFRRRGAESRDRQVLQGPWSGDQALLRKHRDGDGLNPEGGRDPS